MKNKVQKETSTADHLKAMEMSIKRNKEVIDKVFDINKRMHNFMYSKIRSEDKKYVDILIKQRLDVFEKN